MEIDAALSLRGRPRFYSSPSIPTTSALSDGALHKDAQNVPSMARVAAGAFGFLIFSHAFDDPDLYGASSFFETMPATSTTTITDAQK
jgi:hypothetical protein